MAINDNPLNSQQASADNIRQNQSENEPREREAQISASSTEDPIADLMRCTTPTSFGLSERSMTPPATPDDDLRLDSNDAKKFTFPSNTSTIRCTRRVLRPSLLIGSPSQTESSSSFSPTRSQTPYLESAAPNTSEFELTESCCLPISPAILSAGFNVQTIQMLNELGDKMVNTCVITLCKKYIESESAYGCLKQIHKDQEKKLTATTKVLLKTLQEKDALSSLALNSGRTLGGVKDKLLEAQAISNSQKYKIEQYEITIRQLETTVQHYKREQENSQKRLIDVELKLQDLKEHLRNVLETHESSMQALRTSHADKIFVLHCTSKREREMLYIILGIILFFKLAFMFPLHKAIGVVAWLF